MREPQLSQKELQEVREMLQSEKRTQWFWASFRIWAGWIASVVTATVGLWVALRQYWQ